VPDAPSPNCQSSAVAGRWAAGRWRRDEDDSTSPRAVTPRAQAGANSVYLRCVLAKAQKPNRVVVIAYLRCFLSLSLFTYKFSIMYVRGLSTCVAWTLADTRPFGFCYSPAVQPPGSFLLQIHSIYCVYSPGNAGYARAYLAYPVAPSLGTHAGPRVGPGDGDRHEEGHDQEEGGGGALVRHCECCRFNRASR